MQQPTKINPSIQRDAVVHDVYPDEAASAFELYTVEQPSERQPELLNKWTIKTGSDLQKNPLIQFLASPAVRALAGTFLMVGIVAWPVAVVGALLLLVSTASSVSLRIDEAQQIKEFLKSQGRSDEADQILINDEVAREISLCFFEGLFGVLTLVAYEFFDLEALHSVQWEGAALQLQGENLSKKEVSHNHDPDINCFSASDTHFSLSNAPFELLW
jgi:hypothetical protein